MLRSFCFTIFNFNDETKTLYNSDEFKKEFKYILIGLETTNDNKEHLQGFCVLWHPKRMNNIKEIFKCTTMHIEIMRGTIEQNYEYCRKENNIFFEHGNKDICGQGNRTDLKEIANKIDSANYKCWGDCIRDNLEEYAKYPHLIKSLFETKPLPKDDKFKPNDFQNRIIDMINTPPDGRTINWICDKTGGKGKTRLCKNLYLNNNAFYCSGGRNNDIFHSYNNEELILIDIPKCNDEFINYSTIEKLKDGIIFSGKFNSRTKIRINNAHLFVFANCLPDTDKMSQDRWNIIEI